jgi:hypothetical protein
MQVGIAVAGFVGALALGVLLGSFLERRNARAVPMKPIPAPEAGEARSAADGRSTAVRSRLTRAARLERRWSIDGFWIPVGLFTVSLFVYAIISKGRQAGLDYFVPLADAFLHGHISLSSPASGNGSFGFLSEMLPGNDGRWYVAYPPAPAVVLLPAVAVFGSDFNQAWMTIFLGAVNVALVSIALANQGVSRRFRVIMSLVFAFGTVVWFSAQIGTAWHMSHVVAMFFMLLAILACQHDRSPFLIGILFAGAITSRMALLLAMPFFLAYFVDRVQRQRIGDRTPFGALGETLLVRSTSFDFRRLGKLVAWLLAGLAIPAVLVFAYNQQRFGSILESGYTKWDFWQTNPNYRWGLFDIHYFRKDFHDLFLSLPNRIDHFPWLAPWVYGGPSLLLTSPIFLWALKARRPDWFNIGAWVSVVPILMTQLLYADTGGNQFGSQTAQEVYPFLILLTVRGMNGRISRLAWVAIAIGLLVNFWGMGFAISEWYRFGRGG